MKTYHWKDDWNRQRPRRLSLSVTDEEADQVRELVRVQGHTSIQSFFSTLVRSAAERTRHALRGKALSRCAECGFERPGDERVETGMKCGPCSYAFDSLEEGGYW